MVDQDQAIDQLLDIGVRMAQELREFVDEAEKQGTPLRGVEELLEEWEAIHRITSNS